MSSDERKIVTEFAQRLKAARLRAKLTQAALAALVPRMTREGVARFEGGNRNPGLVTVVQLARALKVGVAELVGD